MKFTTVIATILSMAAFAIAAPVSTEINARQNHGMCVKSDNGQVTQILDC
ncbi:hypothetical protein GQ44DRAFT_770696 [Phaeosphaeriaceae sp. PMI808]|nr:hypothetical protein GQ44DRAFT_770696 [Phaeosphaeriaceae sp. PMI808]